MSRLPHPNAIQFCPTRLAVPWLVLIAAVLSPAAISFAQPPAPPAENEVGHADERGEASHDHAPEPHSEPLPTAGDAHGHDATGQEHAPAHADEAEHEAGDAHGHEEPGHADDHGDGGHEAGPDEDAIATAAVKTGRPWWVWPATALLLLGAAAGPTVARRRGWRVSSATVAAAFGLASIALLLATRPAPVGLSGETDEHDDHTDHAAGESNVLELHGEALTALGLETELVAPVEFATGLQATGRIVAVEARQAHLGSRIAGRLSAVRVKLGDRVEAGEAVANLDSVDAAQAAAGWREAVARAEAAERNLAVRRELVASGTYSLGPLEDARRNVADARVAQAQAASELAQAKNEAEAARAELARSERLASSGSYTTAAVEDARTRLADAERALAEARSAVTAAEADATEAAGAVDIARTRLANAESLASRTGRLAATGELDRAPLEQAENALAAARSQLRQAEAGVEQARQQAARGEELYRSELIALNDLESRRTTLREREAQRDEAETAVANASAALARAEQISAAKMTSGRAEQEAQNAVAEARRELSAAEARQLKAQARVSVVAGGVAPAETAVANARAALQREEALAGDKTRAQSVIEAARLRVAQAERLAQGKSDELAEAKRKVDVAAAALAREERLAAAQVRGREQLFDSEREVRAARVARDNAAEILRLLGSSPNAAARGPVTIPIRSPLSGIVTALDATVGEAVDASQTLLTVVDLSEVYLEADVYEKDLPEVQPGQLVRVRVRAYPDETFLGTVASIGGELDPETRAAHVRARIDNPAGRLRPGMFASASFETSRTGEALTVPSIAVQEIEGQTVVFVPLGPEQFELRPVTLGRKLDGRIEVLSGLTTGDRVVTDGSYLLKSERLKGELGHGHAH